MVQLSSEDVSSFCVAVDLILKSRDQIRYSHRHKVIIRGCDECEQIVQLNEAIQRLVPLIKGKSL